MKCLALVLCGIAAAELLQSSPVSKVVSLLEDIKTKIEEEGDTDEKDFKDYECWCKEVEATKQEMIDKGLLVVKKAEAEIKDDKAAIDVLQHHIMELGEEKSEKETSAEQGTKVQDDSHAQNMKNIANGEDFVSKVEQVQSVLNKENEASFIQVASIASKTKYDPKVASIDSLLSAQKASTNREVKTTQDTDARQTREFKSWMADVKEQIGIIDTDLKDERAKEAATEVELAEDTELKETTEEQVKADKAFLEEAKQSCGARKEEYVRRSTLRVSEAQGVEKALELLADNRELLSKTTLLSLRSSFLQVSSVDKASSVHKINSVDKIDSADSAVLNAVGVLRAKATKTHSLRLALLASRVQQAQPAGAFTTVLGEIDKMEEKLKAEAKSDSEKKEHCKAEYHSIAQKTKQFSFLSQKSGSEVSKIGIRMDELADDMAAAQKEVTGIDEDLNESLSLRDEENKEFKKTVSDAEAAKSVLDATSKELKAYFDELDKASAAKSLLQSDPDDKLSDVLKDLKTKEKKYTLSKDDSQRSASEAVLALLQRLGDNLEEKIKAAKDDEVKAQTDYEKGRDLLLAANETLSKKIIAIEGMASNSADAKMAAETTKQNADGDLKAQEDYKAAIQQECDYILEKFDERADDRESEMSGLRRAKELLSGSSLVQKEAHVETPRQSEDRSSLLSYLGIDLQ